eukprot:TRINITY_DN61_c0_g1_i1.p1 TRINITY_DN61_c0_g1~~TRINITY_DN61_c0_g1_i1.p1  ORF type:complete len:350 (+),score=23.53 TRINITY_DN61_c0_g1_i1:119-1168(+)
MDDLENSDEAESLLASHSGRISGCKYLIPSLTLAAVACVVAWQLGPRRNHRLGSLTGLAASSPTSNFPTEAAGPNLMWKLLTRNAQSVWTLVPTHQLHADEWHPPKMLAGPGLVWKHLGDASGGYWMQLPMFGDSDWVKQESLSESQLSAKQKELAKNRQETQAVNARNHELSKREHTEQERQHSSPAHQTPSPHPGPTPIPRPSPGPIPHPSPTPIPHPSPTPIPHPSPTPTPHPSPTPIPHPSPTRIPRPSPTPTPHRSSTPTLLSHEGGTDEDNKDGEGMELKESSKHAVAVHTEHDVHSSHVNALPAVNCFVILLLGATIIYCWREAHQGSEREVAPREFSRIPR